MANPYFLGCDLSIPTYTWSAGANASYPVTNLQTYFESNQAVSAATTDNQTLNIDMGSAVACDTVVAANHNFGGCGATSIVLQYNTNDDTDWSDAVTAHTFNLNNNNQVTTFSSVTKRYWRIKYSKGSALSFEPVMGQVFLGTRLAFESTYEWDFAKANRSYETQETTSLNGSLRMSQSFAGRKTWDLMFRLQSSTFATSWDTFMQIVRGKLRPFYFVDVDGTTIEYVHLDSDLIDLKRFRYNQNNLRIPLKSQLTA